LFDFTPTLFGGFSEFAFLIESIALINSM